MSKSKRWVVKTGINYPSQAGKGPQVRAEPGDVVEDLPAKSVPWLLEQGIVEEVGS